MPKDYAGLCQLHQPRPIADKVDFENVTGITDALAGHKLTADQEDYYDLLWRLIEDFEKEHAQLTAPNASGLAARQNLLDNRYFDRSAALCQSLFPTFIDMQSGWQANRPMRRCMLSHAPFTPA